VATLSRPETRLRRVADFDALAGVYRWMEWLSFGPWLGICRMAFLHELTGARSAAVLGDGDGRFTARLLEASPGVRVEAVDASEAMLYALLRRAGEDAGRVRTWHGDARAWPEEAQAWPENARGWPETAPARPETGQIWPETGQAPFDLIATHFFLDCLTTAEVAGLASRIAAVAAPGAGWVISEFAVPPGWFGRWVARPLIRLLYSAFGWLTGLEVRQLPDYAAGLHAAGFRLERRRSLLGGLLTAEIWHLRAPAVRPTALPRLRFVVSEHLRCGQLRFRD
jgi:SAM-dependent methyltransferase